MPEKQNSLVGMPTLPVKEITVGEHNVRTLDKDKGIDELANSIQEHGLLQPIVVFQEGNQYSLVIGQRRLLAFKKLKKMGYTKFNDIPVIIMSGRLDEERLRILSLSENIHRVELNRTDVIEVISYLYKKHNKSAKKVADILGKSIGYVYDHLKIQDAPDEIKEMLSKREINKEDVKRVMEIAPRDKATMIKLAKEMKRLTPPERKRLAEVAKTTPDEKVTQLIRKARKPHIEEKIIVPLTPQLRTALDRAVKAIGLPQEEVAQKALKEWLRNNGYFKE